MNSNQNLAYAYDAASRDERLAAPTPGILGSAMNDFWSGMQFLLRYGARCNANAESIGQNNLRLLHQTLLGDSHYRAALAAARRESLRHALPSYHTLYQSAKMRADMVTLQKGGSLPVIPQAHSLHLLLSISGKARMNDTNPPAMAPTRRFPNYWSRPARHLKPNDVIWVRHNGRVPRLLTAVSKTCVLLSLLLPLDAFLPSPDEGQAG
jgi:hypothetical protein